MSDVLHFIGRYRGALELSLIRDGWQIKKMSDSRNVRKLVAPEKK